MLLLLVHKRRATDRPYPGDEVLAPHRFRWSRSSSDPVARCEVDASRPPARAARVLRSAPRPFEPCGSRSPASPVPVCSSPPTLRGRVRHSDLDRPLPRTTGGETPGCAAATRFSPLRNASRSSTTGTSELPRPDDYPAGAFRTPVGAGTRRTRRQPGRVGGGSAFRTR